MSNPIFSIINLPNIQTSNEVNRSYPPIIDDLPKSTFRFSETNKLKISDDAKIWLYNDHMSRNGGLDWTKINENQNFISGSMSDDGQVVILNYANKSQISYFNNLSLINNGMIYIWSDIVYAASSPGYSIVSGDGRHVFIVGRSNSNVSLGSVTKNNIGTRFDNVGTKLSCGSFDFSTIQKLFISKQADIFGFATNDALFIGTSTSASLTKKTFNNQNIVDVDVSDLEIAVIVQTSAVTYQLIMSYDKGNTWQTSTSFDGVVRSVSLGNLAQKILVSGNNRLYYSGDNGTNWNMDLFRNNRVPSKSITNALLTYEADKIIITEEDRFFISVDNGLSWSQRWYDSKLSKSGSVLIANEEDRGVYVNKVEKLVNTTNSTLGLLTGRVACSYDGEVLGFASTNGFVAISTNSGNSWSVQTTIGYKKWRSIDISDDGNTIIVVAKDDYMYISNNRGLSWVVSENIGQRSWTDVALSVDSQTIYAVSNITAKQPHQPAVSKDGGQTWSPMKNLPISVYISMAGSDDGKIILVAQRKGKVYVSTDQENFEIANIPTSEWVSIDTTSDGSKIVIAEARGHIYMSTDLGQTWIQEPAFANYGKRDWTSVSITDDGYFISASEYNGYTYAVFSAPISPLAIDDPETDPTISPSPTPTLTATNTVTPTSKTTRTPTPTVTATNTPTLTVSPTITNSLTATATATSTVTPSISQPTQTPTLTPNASPTPTATTTSTPTPTTTRTPTRTPTTTVTATRTPRPTTSISRTPATTPTSTVTRTPQATSTPTKTVTPSSSSAPSVMLPQGSYTRSFIETLNIIHLDYNKQKNAYIIAEYNGPLYTSYDDGETWNTIESMGNNIWTRILWVGDIIFATTLNKKVLIDRNFEGPILSTSTINDCNLFTKSQINNEYTILCARTAGSVIYNIFNPTIPVVDSYLRWISIHDNFAFSANEIYQYGIYSNLVFVNDQDITNINYIDDKYIYFVNKNNLKLIYRIHLNITGIRSYVVNFRNVPVISSQSILPVDRSLQSNPSETSLISEVLQRDFPSQQTYFSEDIKIYDFQTFVIDSFSIPASVFPAQTYSAIGINNTQYVTTDIINSLQRNQTSLLYITNELIRTQDTVRVNNKLVIINNQHNKIHQYIKYYRKSQSQLISGFYGYRYDLITQQLYYDRSILNPTQYLANLFITTDTLTLRLKFLGKSRNDVQSRYKYISSAHKSSKNPVELPRERDNFIALLPDNTIVYNDTNTTVNINQKPEFNFSSVSTNNSNIFYALDINNNIYVSNDAYNWVLNDSDTIMPKKVQLVNNQLVHTILLSAYENTTNNNLIIPPSFLYLFYDINSTIIDFSLMPPTPTPTRTLTPTPTLTLTPVVPTPTRTPAITSTPNKPTIPGYFPRGSSTYVSLYGRIQKDSAGRELPGAIQNKPVGSVSGPSFYGIYDFFNGEDSLSEGELINSGQWLSRKNVQWILSTSTNRRNPNQFQLGKHLPWITMSTPELFIASAGFGTEEFTRLARGGNIATVYLHNYLPGLDSISTFRLATNNNLFNLNNFVFVGNYTNEALRHNSLGYKTGAGNRLDIDPFTRFLTGMTSIGAVNYGYYISQYKVTNCEYTYYLNAQDPEGNNPFGIYDNRMQFTYRNPLESIDLQDPILILNQIYADVQPPSIGGGISFDRNAPNGKKYAVKEQLIGDFPVNFINPDRAQKYINWLNNDGLYYGKVNIERSDNIYYRLPSKDELYKAGLYKGGGLKEGYWHYGHQSDSALLFDSEVGYGGNIVQLPAKKSDYICAYGPQPSPTPTNTPSKSYVEPTPTPTNTPTVSTSKPNPYVDNLNLDDFNILIHNNQSIRDAVCSTNGNRIAILLDNGIIYISTDRGQNWKKLNFTVSDFTTHMVCFDDLTRIYLRTSDARILAIHIEFFATSVVASNIYYVGGNNLYGNSSYLTNLQIRKLSEGYRLYSIKDFQTITYVDTNLIDAAPKNNNNVQVKFDIVSSGDRSGYPKHDPTIAYSNSKEYYITTKKLTQDPVLPNGSDRYNVLYMKHPPITDKKDNKIKSYTLLTKFVDVVLPNKVLSNNLANMCILIYRNNLQIFSNTAVNTRGLFGFYNDNLDLISNMYNVIYGATQQNILESSNLGRLILLQTHTQSIRIDAGNTIVKERLSIQVKNIDAKGKMPPFSETYKNNFYNKNNIFGSQIDNQTMNNPYGVMPGPVDSSALKNYIYIANNNQMYRSIDLTGYEPLYTHTHEIIDIACTPSGQKVCAIDINGKLIKSTDYGNSFIIENNPTTLHKYLENNYGYRRLFYIDDFLYILLNNRTLFTDNTFDSIRIEVRNIDLSVTDSRYIDATNNIQY
jgi:photosystem II stability/assembly factor-like uncharacterized protein